LPQHKRKSKSHKPKQKPKPKQKKLNLKRTAKNIAKNLWLHLIELPEKERNQVLTALGRAITKKFKPKPRKKKK
jgi:hypothetical protein